MPKIWNIFLLFVFLTGSLQKLTGQNIFFNLASDYKRAEKHYANFSYIRAAELYKQIYQKDTSNGLIQLKIADCYRLLNDIREAELWYTKAVSSDLLLQPLDKLYYAQVLLANGKYEESKLWFSKYNEEIRSDSLSVRKIYGIVNLDLFYKDSLKYPVKEQFINSDQADFCPAYYSGGIVFVSSRENNTIISRIDTRDNSSFFDLYYSKFNLDGSLSYPEKFCNRINGKFHEGPLVFYENETKMIFTGNGSAALKSDSKNDLNRLMLFFAEKNEKGEWGNKRPFTFNSTEYSVAHPAISKEGKTLFFVSDMPGGYGGTDIYMSEYKNSFWTSPVNLGKEINTAGNELFPFVQGDTVLYFSSNGFGGLGGLDIYRAEKRNGKFGNVYNIGFPINSSQDDFGIIFNESGSAGFFSSNRNKEGRDDDIYAFEVVKVEVKGMVVDKLKNNFLEDVKLSIYEGDEEKLVIKNQRDGSFVLNLDPGKEYTLTASCEKYKTTAVHLSTKEFTKGKPLEVKLVLEKSRKAYVRGIVKSDYLTRVPEVTVYYQEKGSGIIDTVVTDENGEFYCEIDSDYEYIFFTEKDGSSGLVSLKSNKKRKGSFLYYVNIEIKKHRIHSIQGVVKSNDTFVGGIALAVKNEMSGLTDSLCTGQDGKFQFDAHSNATYTIQLSWGEKTAVIKGYKAERMREPLMEIFLSDD